MASLIDSSHFTNCPTPVPPLLIHSVSPDDDMITMDIMVIRITIILMMTALITLINLFFVGAPSLLEE